MLVTEHCIDSSLRAYCPYKDCSCLLERPDDEEGGAAAHGQDFPFECPACQRHFCLSCGITGWHVVSAVCCCKSRTVSLMSRFPAESHTSMTRHLDLRRYQHLRLHCCGSCSAHCSPLLHSSGVRAGHDLRTVPGPATGATIRRGRCNAAHGSAAVLETLPSCWLRSHRRAQRGLQPHALPLRR
jgi:hypothetical protein